MKEKMTIYKRSMWTFLVGLITAIFAGVFLYFVVALFTNDVRWIYGISGGVMLILLWMTIVGESIKIEIEGNKLRYYKLGRLKEEINLDNCGARYQIKSDLSFPPTHDISLYFITGNGEEEMETHLDCSALGERRFLRMFDEIEKSAPKQVKKIKIKEQQKGKNA